MQTKESAKIQTLKLIEGSFTVREAREILLSMINSKIQFHNLKNFSTEERFGHPNNASLRRIEELKEARQTVLDFMDEVGHEQKRIIISSFVKMRLE